MKCKDFRPRIHEFFDAHLSASEMALMESHRASCALCNEYYQELHFVRQAVREKIVLPASSAGTILARVTEGNRPLVLTWLSSVRKKSVDFWRELEPGSLWARVSAFPISMVLLALLFANVAPLRVERLVYLIVSTPPWTIENAGTPLVLNVEVIQDRGELLDLVDTAWRLPYEDSLALVAEIKPEGHAEIDSVLESPRSYALLDAVGITLKGSQFKEVGNLASPFFIYSFQKIDVYEQRGL
ncbi:MAG TPA: hypothetical protein VMY18_11155 [Acidobacteriota bacterium]|nr:hypothetical protein [Acidobacteriota bacterium]